MTAVAIVTCAELPELDPDEAALLAPLRELGLTVTPQVWTDESVDWDKFDLTVLRCAWDYAEQRDRFITWAKGVPRLHNGADLIEWNTDKRYLADLAAAAVPVVPTTWLPPSGEVSLPTRGEWVLKPSIGAGSRNAGRYQMETQAVEAADHVAALHRSGLTVMAQPYMSDVDVNGERALVYIDGEFSHAIRKGAMLEGPYRGLDELYKAETITPLTVDDADRELAETALAAVPTDRTLLYARVDLVESQVGTVVLEVEVAEPSLFFGHDPESAARLARAIARRV
ncbi:glutathione synthase/RimK-type ligase-like ATP-grasp enzyme [Stackebrandtia endophytica]|uniref:Glutathione synthase/RimK-type ligase-like ATP-grasp enzyme n=1 Tax=Stackebrandtia endophytica TaxID=1496996 RepID=A0A543B4B6_9ACTN|nr:hypothetical protein [Stackebrandtia endophytica]TQL79661.1 glutathione synthase/RimK-type ligase-like ATP-grasp enzyme [Stackebrandtia endophytica]